MRILGAKLFSAVALLVVFLAFGCARRLSDEALFRESVAAAKTAEGDDQWYAFNEIAEAQAEHGYYADALETLRLVNQFSDQLFTELVTIRAKNGDILGAKNMVVASTSDLKSRGDEVIAVVQATAGDFEGARDTSRHLPDKSRVLEAIGERQVALGDFEGALTTAALMQRGWSDEVFFAVAEKLREHGDKKRAHEIARRITDPDMRSRAEGVSPEHSTQPTDVCGLAFNDAKSGRYADAYERIQTGNCHCNVLGYIYEEANDFAAAERAYRSCQNPADISYGMSELATRYAARGNISEALKCADSVHVTGADFEEGYLAPVLRDIGRAWGKQGPQKTVLKWAQSRPTGFQRAMALLGFAEGVSTSRAGV